MAFEPQQVQVLDYLRARSCCPSPFGRKKGHHNFVIIPEKKAFDHHIYQKKVIIGHTAMEGKVLMHMQASDIRTMPTLTKDII